jgi:hypothetical protein
MRFRASLGILTLLAAFGVDKPTRADDPLLKQLLDRQAAAAIEQARTPHKSSEPPVEGVRILVLTDGRVVDGTIQADLHGYRVQTPEANLFFTFDQVKLVARDRTDAYQKLCAIDPGTHAHRDIWLGRWCLENRLPQEAAFHLRKVLEADPGNQEAKSLLTRLDAAQTAGGFVKVGGMADRAVSDAKIVESLSRLSPAEVKEFVIGVQPILLARCGNARCHGAAGATEFHLERVHLAAGGNRVITGRNLDSVLQQVDPKFARRSPLLQKAIEAHGGVAHAPLSGPGAADVQKARLIAWLTSVSPELARFDREDSARRSVEKIAQAGKPQPTRRDSLVVPASATGIDPSMIRPIMPPASSAAAKTDPKTQEKPKNDLGPLTDPFDPAQFNRGK